LFITFAASNQIFFPFEECLVLLRRAERLGSVKPWQPSLIKRIKVPIPNPGKNREMIKIKHGNNEFDSPDSQQFHHATHAYVHAPAVISFSPAP